MNERNRYKYVRLQSTEPEPKQPSDFCHLCKGQKYPLFRTLNRVAEASLLPNQPPLGAEVELLTCTKCLKYIYHQPLPAYNAQVRANIYNERFSGLLDWCEQHPEITAELPTLRQFVHLATEGKQFKPALVSHVVKLIDVLKGDINRITYLRLLTGLAADQRNSTLEHIRFRIDSAEQLSENEYRQLKQFIFNCTNVNQAGKDC
jgi:hypothetical protein